MTHEFQNLYKDLYPDSLNVKGFGEPVRYLKFKGNEDCIDLGSGGGFDCLELSKRTSGKVVGIDLQPKMIEFAEKNNNRGIKYIQDNFIKNTLEDCSFDILISNCAFLHTPDKSSILLEIKRLLKPGGQFCFSDTTIKERKNDLSITSDEWMDLLKNIGFREFHIVKEENIYQEGIYIDLFVTTFWGIK